MLDSFKFLILHNTNKKKGIIYTLNSFCCIEAIYKIVISLPIIWKH